MTSDETEEVGVGEADVAEGAEMAEVAEVAIHEDDLTELELDDEFDWMDESDVDEGDDVDQIYAVAVARGLGVSEDVEEDEDEEGDEILLTEDDALEDEESGWLPDPDVEGQERFWDGTEWTDQVRPVDEEPDFRGRLHLPDHVPELQRALAAATADIDDVEARLSTLFDRGQGKRGARAGADAGAGGGAGAGDAARGGAPIHDEFGGASGAGGDASSHDGGDPIPTGGEGTGAVSGEDDEETFAELDAALAAEAPEKSERRFFKRRS
jgi:hypothetical protein